MGKGSDAFSDLKAAYKYHVTAYALLFKGVDSDNKVHKALRVDAPDIGKEFTDEMYIGRDPEGFLYYNDLTTFGKPNDLHAKSENVTYKIDKLNNPSDDNLLVKITFTRENADRPHAVFLAEDPLGSVDAADMNGYSNTGNWTPLTLGSVNARVRKESDYNKITITIETIHKEVTIENKEDTVNQRQPYFEDKKIDVEGILHFKDINDLNSGKYANWNDDRIVFFSNDFTGTDFVAFFIPFEYHDTDVTLQYDPKSTPTALTFGNVTWKDVISSECNDCDSDVPLEI